MHAVPSEYRIRKFKLISYIEAIIKHLKSEMIEFNIILYYFLAILISLIFEMVTLNIACFGVALDEKVRTFAVIHYINN